MSRSDIDQNRTIYCLAYDFLLNLNIDGITQDLLEHYLQVPDTQILPTTVEEIYKRLLESAQNANMKSGVIGGAIGGVENLGTVLPLPFPRPWS